MKSTRLREVMIIGLALCAMLIVQGSVGSEGEGVADTDQGARQPTLNDSRIPKDMVLIPGGTISGTNPLEDGETHCRWSYPATYNITLDDFLMDKYLVTKRLWNWVRDDPATVFRGYELRAGRGQGPNHPVHSITWFEAVKWLNARSELEGREPVYYLDAAYTQIFRSGSGGSRGDLWEVYVKASADGYRLPTSDQWEYAARGGLQSKLFPWGDRIDHSKANYQAWGENFSYDDGPEDRLFHPEGLVHGNLPYTTPIDRFEPNPYGLYDMAGNLVEWCVDWDALSVGSARAQRGGGWNGSASYCRVACRSSHYPYYADRGFGFRAVLHPNPSDAP